MRNNIIVAKLIKLTNTILAYCNGVNYLEFSGNSMLVEAKGISQGISQGIVQQKEADVRKFLIMYHDVENASKLFDMPFENVKEIADRM